MIELFVSVISHILSGLKIHLAEKHMEQDLKGAKDPFRRTVAGSP